jgi:hypothetical protein
MNVMNTILKAVTIVAGLTCAAPAIARPVDITVKAASYSGQRAYMVAYIVDPNGRYVSTVLTAGRGQYLGHLDRWVRMFQRAGSRVDGTSGASIGSGETMNTSLEIPDAMLNAGYTLRVESAVENQRYMPDDAAVTLIDANNGQAVAGTGYVQSVTVSY